MQSKIRPASIKHVSYSIIVCVWYRTSTLQWEQAASHALRLVLEKYLCTSFASALAASRRVLCTPDLTPKHSTAACTHKMTAKKKINDGTEAPKKKQFFFAGKINIINKHDAGITNVTISCNLEVHSTMFCVSFPSGNVLILSWKCNFRIYFDIQAITTLLCLLLVLYVLIPSIHSFFYFRTALLKSDVFRHSKAYSSHSFQPTGIRLGSLWRGNRCILPIISVYL